MSLLRGLYTSLGGLRASQVGLATASQNIANVATEGYSRQRVALGTEAPIRAGHRSSLLGSGVRVEGIRRAHDRFLTATARRDRGALSASRGRQYPLAAVERLFSQDGLDLGGALDGFFNAARALSLDAGSRAARVGFLDAAAQVTSGFRDLARELRALQVGIDGILEQHLSEVNGLAGTVAELNERIASSEVGGQLAANDLRDRRDQAIDRLGELVDLQILAQDDGGVTLSVGGRWTLVQGGVSARLETQANAERGGALDVVHVGSSGARAVITGALAGPERDGAIAGLLLTRDGDLADRLGALDQLARAFGVAVNGQHQMGFGLDGVGARELLRVPPAGENAALGIALHEALAGQPDRVAAALDPNAGPGDNRNLLALADLQGAPQAALDGGSFISRWGDLVHAVGQSAADNDRLMALRGATLEQSEGLQRSLQGVSLDDEMVDLTMFQKHFEANTRVIRAVDELLDQVMGLIG